MSTENGLGRPGDLVGTQRFSASGAESVKLATGHGNVDNWATHAKLATRKKQRKLRLAGWNVRGLNQQGKLQILQEELKRCKIDVASISETHWQDKGHFRSSEYTVYFSGSEGNNNHGVGILISNSLDRYVLGYEPINERICSIKINTTPCILNILSLYAPTSDAGDDEIEDFYKAVEEAISKIPMKETLLLIGDYNAKIGNTIRDNHLRQVVGKFGLGDRNNRGERLIQFCLENGLAIANSMFENHKRRLYTWVSPDGKYKNQIDYILVRQRWRSSVQRSKTLPSADCGSDHQLLMCEYSARLKKSHRRQIKKLPLLKSAYVQHFNNSIMNEMNLLSQNMANESPEKIWQFIKRTIIASLKEMPAERADSKWKHWITTETRDLILERRRVKAMGLNNSMDLERYNGLNRIIQKATRKDKNAYLATLCEEVQRHAETNSTKDLFQKIRSITSKFKPRHWAINDQHGAPVTELDKIASAWKDYCGSLYADPGSIVDELGDYEEEPDILLDEVKAAIKKLRDGKATGIDQISAEVLKVLDDRAVRILHSLCQRIWKTGLWPEDWSTSVLLPLHKKGPTTNCDNYRLIALISHSSKIMLYVLQARLNTYIEHQIAEEQAGFVKGRGTREHILNARQLTEKAREYGVVMYLCFIDYEKAFDNVRWPKLWSTLREIGVPIHLISLIKHLYETSEARVRIGNIVSDKCVIRKGVRQGCVLSPLLYKVYSEVAMREVFEEWNGGIKIAGRKFSNLRFADDTTLISSSVVELLELIQRLEVVSLEFGLKINSNKTKIMIVSRDHLNHPNRIGRFQVVDRFVYLGSMLHNSGSCEVEIRRRIEMARSAMTQMSKIWKDRNITKATKILLVNTLIFPIYSYASETWTIRTADRRRIDAFEMWVWRRMLRIPWTAKRTNVSVLKEIKPVQRLSSLTFGRVLKFFGHIARHDNMEKLIVQGQPEGKRRRGRSPTRWTEIVEKLVGASFSSVARQAGDRSRWRKTVQRVIQGLDSM